jgi:hypothetical protein
VNCHESVQQRGVVQLTISQFVQLSVQLTISQFSAVKVNAVGHSCPHDYHCIFWRSVLANRWPRFNPLQLDCVPVLQQPMDAVGHFNSSRQNQPRRSLPAALACLRFCHLEAGQWYPNKKQSGLSHLAPGWHVCGMPVAYVTLTACSPQNGQANNALHLESFRPAMWQSLVKPSSGASLLLISSANLSEISSAVKLPRQNASGIAPGLIIFILSLIYPISK